MKTTTKPKIISKKDIQGEEVKVFTKEMFEDCCETAKQSFDFIEEIKKQEYENKNKQRTNSV